MRLSTSSIRNEQQTMNKNQRTPLRTICTNVSRSPILHTKEKHPTPNRITLRPLPVSKRTPGLGPPRRVLSPPPGERSDSEVSSSFASSQAEKDEAIRSISRNLSDIGTEDDQESSLSLSVSSGGEDPLIVPTLDVEHVPLFVDGEEASPIYDSDMFEEDVLLGDVSISSANQELSDIVGKETSEDGTSAHFDTWSRGDLLQEVKRSNKERRTLQSALRVMEKAYDRQSQTLESVRGERIERLRQNASEAKRRLDHPEMPHCSSRRTESTNAPIVRLATNESRSETANETNYVRSKWSNVFENDASTHDADATTDVFPTLDVGPDADFPDLMRKWRDLEIWYSGRIEKAMDEDIKQRMSSWSERYSTGHSSEAAD